MSEAATNIVAVVIVLGFLILIHEWGHFIAAKMFGVRVDVFSIGFGPRIWGRKRGDTDYRISALPLGGYVKMAGDNPVEERSGESDELLSKPRWQRAVIVSAGAFMNFVTAIVLVAGLLTVGMPQPVYLDQPVVLAGVLKGSPAERAGLQAGDRIARLNEVRDPNWEEAITELLLTPTGKNVPVVVERDGEMVTLELITAPPSDAGELFESLGYPEEPVYVGVVAPDLPADRAGIEVDDQITAVSDRPVLSSAQFRSLIQESEGQPITLTILRAGEEMRIALKPSRVGRGDAQRWQIGIAFRPATVQKTFALPEALVRSMVVTWKRTVQIYQVVIRLVEGTVSLKQLEGPVGIARQSGQAAKRGLLDLLDLTAIISLNLAILNLLPIPILDGGHLLMLAIEGTLRRDLSIAIKERFVQVGLVFLLVIFVIVMYNDVLKYLAN